MSNAARPVAIFVSFSGEGGVERMILNLAQGMCRAGRAVDLVLVKADSEHLRELPAGVRVIDLGARHTLNSLPALARYLKRERPAALLAAKDRAIKVAVLARWWSGVQLPLAGRLGTTLSAALAGRSRLKKWFWYSGMRLFYRHVDRIIAVSQGVADDVRTITGLPPERICVVRNPVWRNDIAERAAETVAHPWFVEHSVPIVLGAGRLTRQKDFPTLIRAFARLRAQRRCRLVILGNGQLRGTLEALARELGVGDDVSFAGFVSNPYAYTARADVFVLSSAWEGSPNVLTEALALGTPVVSTDCPSGPREILDGGRYGALVAVGDVEALAQKIADTLDRPLSRAHLQEAAQAYRVETSVSAYLAVLERGESTRG